LIQLNSSLYMYVRLYRLISCLLLHWGVARLHPLTDITTAGCGLI
jgi:hypothetical protein